MQGKESFFYLQKYKFPENFCCFLDGGWEREWRLTIHYRLISIMGSSKEIKQNTKYKIELNNKILSSAS